MFYETWKMEYGILKIHVVHWKHMSEKQVRRAKSGLINNWCNLYSQSIVRAKAKEAVYWTYRISEKMVQNKAKLKQKPQKST